jgi:hypothetical protein
MGIADLPGSQAADIIRLVLTKPRSEAAKVAIRKSDALTSPCSEP